MICILIYVYISLNIDVVFKLYISFDSLKFMILITIPLDSVYTVTYIPFLHVRV